MTLSLYFKNSLIKIDCQPWLGAWLSEDFRFFTWYEGENQKNVFAREEEIPSAKDEKVQLYDEIANVWEESFHIKAKICKPLQFEKLPKPGLILMKHLGGTAYGWGQKRLIIYGDKNIDNLSKDRKNQNDESINIENKLAENRGSARIYIDFKRKKALILATDKDLLYHYTYYLIIARSSEMLDLSGYHRFHSAALRYENQTIMLSAMPGGGKSTLALNLMKNYGCRLISEDTPLIGDNGNIFPFLVRLSMREKPDWIDNNLCRLAVDPVFGPKVLINTAFLINEKIFSDISRGGHIFFLRKTSLKEPKIKKMPRYLALAYILFFMMTGLGLPQRAEMLIRFTPRAFFRGLRIIWGRFKGGLSLWKSFESYFLYMNSLVDDNSRALIKKIRFFEG